MARLAVRKRGGSYPWHATCDSCTEERLHLEPLVGAVAVNTRDIGNRTWGLAMLAALSHLRKCHT